LLFWPLNASRRFLRAITLFGTGQNAMNPIQPGHVRATGWDEDGEVRVVELADAGFFVATFQPERVALEAQVPPLIRSWLQACSERQEISSTSTSTVG
jgi:CTP synthase (UTP-ammonia lyase)